ncbi:MAG: hypothetical protein JW395_3928 [Nitrospira sp.]|nr:hypothetical protein [Nitrospira sp.]
MPGVAPHRDSVFLQTAHQGRHQPVIKLIVCQGVQRIHQQGPDPGLALDLVFQESVDDGIQKTLGLAGAGAGGDDDIVVFSNNRLDGLILMLMQLARELRRL